jgi:hypothetical protein
MDGCIYMRCRGEVFCDEVDYGKYYRNVPYRVDARADRVAGRPPNQHAHHHKNEAAAPRTIAIIARFFSRVIDQAIVINSYYLLYVY